MTKTALVVLLALGLAGCGPKVPDSGADEGYETYRDYGDYRARRDAELNGTLPAGETGAPPVAAPPAGTPNPGTPDGDAGAVPRTDVSLDNPRISDEQDFGAVSDRHSIESDAERLRAQREAYQVIEPTAVPRRAGDAGANIVEFALSTSNPRGQKVWRRSILVSQAKYRRNCAKYASNDLAQEAFLNAGGPQRDKLGLDPDGDGFACGWDPAPFRRIAAGR
ncbi:MAG: hypothetical protein GY717_08525 [Rhodobacteraceae bacterium]|nr:hypothetical protein [Paracoccaceae bacterium]